MVGLAGLLPVGDRRAVSPPETTRGFFTIVPQKNDHSVMQPQWHWERFMRHTDSCSLLAIHDRYSDSQRLEQLLSLESEGEDIGISSHLVGSTQTGVRQRR